MNKPVIKQALEDYAKQAWRQYCLFKTLIYLPFLLMFTVINFVVFELTSGRGLLAAIIGSLVVVIGLMVVYKNRIKQIKTGFNSTNSAEIFNQQYKTLEYSCQLALKDPDELNRLQRLQLKRVEGEFVKLVEQDSQRFKPAGLASKSKIAGAWVALSLISAMGYYLFFQLSFLLSHKQHSAAPLNQALGPFSYKTQVSIQPPAYTKLPEMIELVDNLAVLEGSMVTWRMTTFNGTEVKRKPQLRLNDKIFPFELVEQNGITNVWQVTQVINQTGLYQLVDDNPQYQYSQLYAIAITKDQAPKVRILSPNSTLVTFVHNQQPQLTTKIEVSDDFAISEVKLVASLAKGSGEAVKFRDLAVDFDNVLASLEQPKEQSYHKTWDFKALNMEVGDELYFSVHATDNKTPQAQVTRSNTVIVRWLDEDEQVLASEGLLLSYMPEYFRSQRQIIIETEQLIADKAQLSQSQIDEMSVSLGQSQQDLKLKYGQYLGDEVGQGPGDQAEFIGGAAEHANEEHAHQGHVHEEHADDKHGHDSSEQSVSEKLQQAAAAMEHSGHDHDHQQAGLAEDESRGSKEATLAQFVHTHEEVHVGEVSTQNPKAMMKKAVSFMWQAELHLMLSEPEKALPFELQAYKYLKLAKQSERIYVQRLGFEPPPVSEEKRLTGELDDIESYEVEKALALGDGDVELFSQVFSVLNRPQKRVFSQTEQLLLKRLKVRLAELAQSRPALIHYVLNTEKILIANKPQVGGCDDCVSTLSAKLWQLIEVPVSEPIKREAEYLDGDKLMSDFARQLSERGER